MKPWEERWDVEPGDNGDLYVVPAGKGARSGVDTWIAEFADDERRQLAAQAPAMAQLLLQALDGNLHLNSAEDVLRAAGVIP